MDQEIEIPFFSETFDDTNELASEQFYEETVIEKLKKIFPDKQTHMKMLLKLYTICFPDDKPVKLPLFERPVSGVIEEIKDTAMSLDIEKSIQEETDAIKQFYLEEERLKKRVNSIPVLIDFAYLYYVWLYDSTAPIHKMPMTMLKFNLISDALNSPQNALHANFKHCIENYFIRDIRIEKPPFMMRTEMSPTEIKDNINTIVKPICKEILKDLLSFGIQGRTENTKSNAETSMQPEARTDNLTEQSQ